MRNMPNKNFRVAARETRYYYIDVLATSKTEAVSLAIDKKKEMFTLIDDPQNEFKVLAATQLDKDEPADALDFLTRGTKQNL